MTTEMIDDIMMTSSIQIEGFIDEKSVTCDLLRFVTDCLEFSLKNKQDIRQGDNLYQLFFCLFVLSFWSDICIKRFGIIFRLSVLKARALHIVDITIHFYDVIN